LNQPEDYPATRHSGLKIDDYCCPLCGGSVAYPSPAMMEDDDWRLRCSPCLRRFTFDECRVAYLRTHSAQRAMTRTITT
jgi:hypothetical protein